MSNENHKTYIWVRPPSLQHKPSSKASNNVTQKKCGAPGEGEVWGWSPGFYSTTDDGKHHYTLLTNDGEFTIDQSHTAKLLECGDLVLANAWEEIDFTKGVKNNVEEQEEEYNYDDSDDDDDKDPATNPRFADKPIDEPPQDLIELTHLHEPSVVHALRHRYRSCTVDMNGIYTDTGPILLAVNPFKADETGRLYGEEAVERFRVRGERVWRDKREGDNGRGEEEEDLGPHVYAVGDRVFRTMMTSLHSMADSGGGGKSKESFQEGTINQSVLVSGESGAGKTVTTKLLMGYLAQLSKSPTNDASNSDQARRLSVRRLSQLSQQMSIERRILESNPIMESFGNARTVRNDNSSRFGKYIEMKFNAAGGDEDQTQSSLRATLVGASIETYLLEKVRLVHQSPGERNYHIFYELFSLNNSEYDEYDTLGTVLEDPEETKELVNKFGLAECDVQDFSLISSSGTYDRRDGVTDSSTFTDLCRAMSTMGFKREEQIDVFAVTSGLLHASNVTFKLIGEVECALEDSPHLDHFVNLLGLPKEGLNKALCYNEIVVRGETHRKVLSMEQASKSVEALIKATYGTLFAYLVGRINTCVSGDEGRGDGDVVEGKKGGASADASIGILDIFGFESFQSNSFEQLCINYCNEALQQQFNRFVLRKEQEEYDREGIPWSFIEFPENQDVLDLIDFKGTGIINILHDQCRTPGASDKTFSSLMYEKCSSHSRFQADSRQVGRRLFAIHHYAGLVEYSVDGFIEKNRDELPKSGADLLLSSTLPLVKVIAREMIQPSSQASKGKRGGASQRPTVGIQFSAQLHDLRRKIDETSPHYIRCLKPNYMLVPDVFDEALIADQLRCAGVIEAVRVSRLGYPQRYSHSAFITRYRVLGLNAFSKERMADKKYNPAKALVHTISKQIARIENDDANDIGIQVGKTKVFLRRQSYNMLEKLRTEKISCLAVRIQSYARVIVYRKHFLRSCSSTLTIQCFVRQVRAKLIASELRREHNSVLLQKTWRKYRATKILNYAKLVGIWTQVHYRGNLGRAKYNKLNQERRAVQIQAQVRSYIAMKSFKRVIDAVLVIQCARRSYLSGLLLRSKEAEAWDFSAVVQERDRLRTEVSMLKVELERGKESKMQSEVPSEDALTNISEEDEEVKSLRLDLENLSAEKKPKSKPKRFGTTMSKWVSQKLRIGNDSLLDNQEASLPEKKEGGLDITSSADVTVMAGITDNVKANTGAECRETPKPKSKPKRFGATVSEWFSPIDISWQS